MGLHRSKFKAQPRTDANGYNDLTSLVVLFWYLRAFEFVSSSCRLGL